MNEFATSYSRSAGFGHEPSGLADAAGSLTRSKNSRSKSKIPKITRIRIWYYYTLHGIGIHIIRWIIPAPVLCVMMILGVIVSVNGGHFCVKILWSLLADFARVISVSIAAVI